MLNCRHDADLHKPLPGNSCEGPQNEDHQERASHHSTTDDTIVVNRKGRAFNIRNIPDWMKVKPHWVGFKIGGKHGGGPKAKKVPFNPRTGRRASSTDPSTWGSFDEAIQALRDGKYDAIAYAITKDDGVVFIDLDHCLDPETGEFLQDKFEQLVKDLDSYTERSINRDGVHVIAYGEKHTDRCNAEGIECYDGSRFCIMTGDTIPGTSPQVEHRQDAIDTMESTYFPPKTQSNPSDIDSVCNPSPNSLTDDELLNIARTAKNGAKFRKSFDDGDYSGFNSPTPGSCSEAVMSLACQLAFWTGKDKGRMDRLMRKSALYLKHQRVRDKWDEPRGGSTWGQKEIENACKLVTTVYTPAGTEAATPLSPDAVTTIVAELTEHPESLQDCFSFMTPQHIRQVRQVIMAKDGRVTENMTLKRALKEFDALRVNPSDSDKDIANHRMDYDDNGDSVIVKVPIQEVCDTYLQVTGGWPKSVGNHLIVPSDADPEFKNFYVLGGPEDFLAYGQRQGNMKMRPGITQNGDLLVTGAQLFPYMQKYGADKYLAVETLPHEPPLPKHLYIASKPTVYTPDNATGEYLGQLLGLYNNLEDPDVDRVILRSMFLLAMWGVLHGKRPVISIMAKDSGYGKSTLADDVSFIYGGAIEVTAEEAKKPGLKTRLLSADALGKRIVRFDNIKGYFESDVLEALITMREISGHALYIGEASRPNTLTYLLTGNNMMLSRDMADRCYFIHLTQARYDPDWDANHQWLLDHHAHDIRVDIQAALRQPPRTRCITKRDRWPSYGQDILARCTDDPDYVIQRTINRRMQYDETLADEQHLYDVVHHAMTTAAYEHRDYAGKAWLFIASSSFADAYNDYMNTRETTKAISSKVKAHINAGRLPGVQFHRFSDANGLLIDLDSSIGIELQKKIKAKSI
ncbi:MAG: phage NrS-1 polymerase family protein [Armatimonadota bacterium]